ncbi:MAG: glycogen synthase GlgA [Planctomycetota bacterium]|nr:glycogen synthase GlgA [Planctomycetota bacterium]
MSLRICLVSSEVAPFAKTGGLADVVAGLGRYLASEGHDVRIFLPLYGRIARQDAPREEAAEIAAVSVRFNGSMQTFRCRVGTLPDSTAKVYFVDCPEMFEREPIYSSTYEDEHIRFGLLCRAALESCQRLGWSPDVIHCNDWHTGLLPLYLKSLYAWDRLFAKTRTLLTIHNIGYQGQFPARVVGDLGLADHRSAFHQEDLAKGEVNFLKTGLLYADWITTVSRTYAHEIQTPEGGRGLEGVLGARASALTGIVNGVDYGTWDPAVDPTIPARYTVDDLSGKAVCKQKLLERFDLDASDGSLVLGIVSRLTGQKGFDLLPDVLPVVMRDPRVRLCVLGSGEGRYEEYFQWLRDKMPERVGIYRGYHEELAHWIEAGSDAFLMPSAFEPCGLNQMYSLRYGTPPVVRRTGGLVDTVEPFDRATRTGTGFVFEDYDSHALLAAMQELLRAFDDPEGWRQLIRNGMTQDFSWAKQGPDYVALYRRLIG